MILTVAELARAVGKKETYVRQHIHRRHLAIQRRGRHVVVAFKEAVRWAEARGLPFTFPGRANVSLGTEEDRAARLTILVWQRSNEQARNLFTLVRHRRRTALGPWSGEPDATWTSEQVGNELALYSLDTSYAECRKHLEPVLSSGTLTVHEQAIHYALEAKPRNHWAYRDYRRRPDASIRSPFSTHSAAITEYWSFAEEPHKRWLRICESLPASLQSGLRRLSFPLDQYPERVGNLVVAAAEDAITCRLTAHGDQTLRLHVEAKGLLSEAYRATIWASHSGDEVLRREVPVKPGHTVIELASEVDRTGFAICRDLDGQYVDLVENSLAGEARNPVRRATRPIPQPGGARHRVQQRVGTSPAASTVAEYRDESGSRLDRGIRRKWLHRVAYQREAGARREANLVRFGPGRFGDAARYFLSLLSKDSDRVSPVYLADPCFVGHTMADDVAQLFVGVCAAIHPRPLRVLCAEREPDDGPPWWAQYVRKIKADVTVRTFVNRSNERGCFHDRYLITSAREILMTNSFNGWNKYGVTLVGLPFGVYRAEAEQLWAMDAESAASDIVVREIS